ncbi:MAG: ATP-binding cassette domain-containing protein [Bacillota bacterium]
MCPCLLNIQDIYYTYPDGTAVLQGLSTTFEKGGKYALLGANGAGKSTFLLHLIGILKPTRGKIFFNNRELIYSRSSLLDLRSKVGFVFQDPDTQLFSASVWQEVSFGPINLGLPKEEVRERVDQALTDTGITFLKDKAPHLLSCGQKKLVSIAGILAMKPEILIFDEPTASLDPLCTLQIMNLLDQISQRGTTLIMATHNVDIAYSWSDWVLVIKSGRIACEGKPEDVFSNNESLAAGGLSMPVLLEVFRELSVNGYLPADMPFPRETRELIKLLRQNAPHLQNNPLTPPNT